jgi:hypothetical protein
MIHLQDGFSDDTVIVKLNGKEFFNQQHITTQALIGFADTFTTETSSKQAVLEISLPKRGFLKDIQLEISDELHIGISVEGNEIQYIISSTPFGYA